MEALGYSSARFISFLVNDPEKSPGFIYRLEGPIATALVFQSGKLVTTGAQSVEAITEAIQVTADAIRDLGVDIPPDPEATVQNIVMSGDFGQELHLNAIAIGRFLPGFIAFSRVRCP